MRAIRAVLIRFGYRPTGTVLHLGMTGFRSQAYAALDPTYPKVRGNSKSIGLQFLFPGSETLI